MSHSNTNPCEIQPVSEKHPIIRYLQKKKFAGYTIAKKLNYTFTDQYPGHLQTQRVSLKLKECCSLATLYQDENNESKVHSDYKCRHKLCPICQASRQYRITRNVTGFMEKNFGPDIHQLHFLTVTTRNVDPKHLKATLENLARGWSRLVRHKGFPYSGFIKALETTIGNGGAFHPHYHIMLVRNRHEDPSTWHQSKWVKKLRKVMNLPYDPITDIRLVRLPKEKTKEALDIISSEISKTTSYAHKGSSAFFTDKTKDLPNNALRDTILTFINATHRKRAIVKGGPFFKGLALTPNKKTNQDESENENENRKVMNDQIHLIYNHDLGRYIYKEIQESNLVIYERHFFT